MAQMVTGRVEIPSGGSISIYLCLGFIPEFLIWFGATNTAYGLWANQVGSTQSTPVSIKTNTVGTASNVNYPLPYAGGEKLMYSSGVWNRVENDGTLTDVETPRQYQLPNTKGPWYGVTNQPSEGQVIYTPAGLELPNGSDPEVEAFGICYLAINAGDVFSSDWDITPGP